MPYLRYSSYSWSQKYRWIKKLQNVVTIQYIFCCIEKKVFISRAINEIEVNLSEEKINFINDACQKELPENGRFRELFNQK